MDSKLENSPFNRIFIRKLCINCNVKPKSGNLEKAVHVLETLTGQKPYTSKSRLTIRGWGIKRNDRISTSVSVGSKNAMKLLETALGVKEFELPATCFSETGNFGFGIEEHIDLGIKYDPGVGIFGMNFYVVLEKPGTRVARRKRCRSRLGKKQRVSQEEAQQWFVSNFNGVLKK